MAALILLLLVTVAAAASQPCGPSLTVLKTGASADSWQSVPGYIDLRCSVQASEPGLPSSCCCRWLPDQHMHCLPHVIIAGAQKSGSTALLGYLLNHPNFAAPKRKELHFFDNSARFNNFSNPLSASMALKTYLVAFPTHNPSKLSGEATPSYILGTQTAKRMSSLIPDVKILVVLRNPVHRFYSEYHMKLRRVKRQVDPSRDTAALLAALEVCQTAENSRQPTDGAWVECMLQQLGKLPAFVAQVTARANRMRAFLVCLEAMWTTHSTTQLSELGKCLTLPAIRPEQLGPLEEVVAAELLKVRACTLSASRIGRSTVELIGGARAPLPLLEWGSNACWPSGSDSFISRDFVVRGIYYPQIVRMFQFIPKENVLILEDEDLLQRAPDTMQSVWRFLGMPDADVANLTSEHVYQKISDAFPSFENTTGWSMHSKYDAMPAAIQAELQAVYKPFNQQLYSFLNRRFNWDEQ